MKQLNGKVAVVTGAGSGIGRATAIALAGEGCNLALADMESQRLNEVSERVSAYSDANQALILWMFLIGWIWKDWWRK